MTTSAALIVIIVGLLIAMFISAAIGMIVTGIGIVGLILALVNGSTRTRSL